MGLTKKFTFKDVVVLLLIFYIFYVRTFIPALLHKNLGLPEIPYTLEMTLAFPIGFLVLAAIFRKSFKLPYFFEFLAVEALFIFFESEFFRGSNLKKVFFFSIFSALMMAVLMDIGYFGHIRKIQ